MTQKQVGQHTIKCFRRTTNYTCVFHMACACDRKPFQSKAVFRTFFSVSIVDVEQLNVSWDRFWKI